MEIQKQSGPGIASTIISVLCGLGLIVIIGFAGFIETTTPGGIEQSGLDMALSMLLLLVMALQIVSLTLGIVGLFQKNRKKLFAILGTILSVLMMLTFLGIILSCSG